MAKTAKRIIKYRNASLPENLGDLLTNADENDLRILIALMMAADENGEVADGFSVEDALGLDKVSVDASLKFWRGAGVIGGARVASAKTKPAEVKTDAETKKEIETAHKDGVVEQSAGVTNYRSAELADLFEKRMVTAAFIDEAQRVFGKTFNSYDTGIVVGLVDQLGFDEEAVLAILAYVTRIGKKGLRYCEKVAISLYDDGYTGFREVQDRIEVIERSSHTMAKIKQLFGIGERSLSKTEKETFERWTQKFGYDIDVIKCAYDIMIDRIQKPVPKYANTIIEKWYAEGLRTVEEIAAYESKQKESKASEQKSYDLDGFFEAALQRSYDDLK